MIIDARGDRHTLERLLRLYWPPVYAFIRRQGFKPHDASDLTQEFLSSVVLSRNLLGRADPSRGRFRSFLKQSLRNFLIDHHRANKARSAILNAAPLAGASTPSEDADRAPDAGAPGTPPPGPDEFDREWAATIVRLALERLEDTLRADGMTAHWVAFETNVVSPTIRKTQPIALEELARRINVADPSIVSNMLQTTKRRFQRILREIVADTVANPEAVEEELRHLKRLLA